MEIATNKYHRFKMKIDKSYNCTFCTPEQIETLEHIYLKCPKTFQFRQKITDNIQQFLEPNYSEGLAYFTINHQNNTIIVEKFRIGASFFRQFIGSSADVANT